MNKNDDLKILKEEFVYKGFIAIKQYQLQFRLFNGGWSPILPREVAVRKNVAAVLAFDPDLDKVVLVEQFRIGALDGPDDCWLLEVIAGLMEFDETPEELAYREAHEEAGLKILDMLPICNYWVSPGGSNEYVSLFCARVDASHAGGIHGLLEEHEDIRVQVMDTAQAFAAIGTGKINNAASIIALQWLEINKPDLKKRWRSIPIAKE